MLASVEDYKKATEQLNLNLGKTKIVHGDARNIKMKDNFVDGIITSPPYSIGLDIAFTAIEKGISLRGVKNFESVSSNC